VVEEAWVEASRHDMNFTHAPADVLSPTRQSVQRVDIHLNDVAVHNV
jgi:hypothetical protein